MAIYHFSVQIIGRSSGRSSVAAAAYRAGERLHDERLDRDHDFRAKSGVEHSEIMLPQGASERLSDRETLWNEVEATEKRKDAQLAREVEFSIPREMDKAQGIDLARDFVAQEFVARGMIADLNVHWDVGADGQPKPHAHVMLTMREVGPDGFGQKERDWNRTELVEQWRDRWADHAPAQRARVRPQRLSVHGRCWPGLCGRAADPLRHCRAQWLSQRFLHRFRWLQAIRHWPRRRQGGTPSVPRSQDHHPRCGTGRGCLMPGMVRRHGQGSMRPFLIAIEQAKLDRIRQRVAAFEWPWTPADGPWESGTDAAFLKRMQTYWLESYDWRAAEREFNRFSQFKAEIDGLEVHFIHEKGSGVRAMPLLLLHGWPGSTYEFQRLIEPLAHPERFGGAPETAFDVVVASLPGYGFSGKPDRPIGPRQTAAMMNALMTQVLGYPRYFTQGGDWGSLICGWIGFDHARHNAAMHLNMVGLSPGGDVPGLLGSRVLAPTTAEELAWAQDTGMRLAEEGGYIALQSTRPQTLGYGLSDSPMGVAAWIAEKFHAWADLEGRAPDEVFGLETLLTNIMIYLVTDSFVTSTWMYRGAAREGVSLPTGARVEVPTALANLPRDLMANPPRSYAERAYNIVRWTDFARGGHFAALEEPNALIADIRAFFAEMRDRLQDVSEA